MLFILAFLACKDGTMDISGNGAYASFKPSQAYFGNSYLVFITKPLECIDMYWVQRINLDGEEPPYDGNIDLLQITYNESEIVEGSFTIAGEAPIKAEYISINDGSMSVAKSTEGTLDMDSVVEESLVSGAFNFAFSEGEISGTFDTEWCINIK